MKGRTFFLVIVGMKRPKSPKFPKVFMVQQKDVLPTEKMWEVTIEYVQYIVSEKLKRLKLVVFDNYEIIYFAIFDFITGNKSGIMYW